MCEIDWEIVQKFVCCLIWPAIVIILFLLFRKHFIALVDRIIKESKSIDVGGFLKISFMEAGKLKEEIKKGVQPTAEQVNQVISATVAAQIEGISNFGEEYVKSNFDQRRILESRINEYSVGLQPEDIQPLFKSSETGHKIAAAIALEPILYRMKIDPADIPTIKDFIVESLKDRNSYLRYEALQIIFQSDKLKIELGPILEEMKNNDSNSAIKNILRLFLK